MEEKLYTSKEVQSLLKVTRQTLHVWRKKGILKTIKIGGKVFVKNKELEKLLEENRKGE